MRPWDLPEVAKAASLDAYPGWRAAALGLAGLVLLGLYLGFPDRVFVFDGVIFSGIIDRSIDDWRQELFNGRHLLFNPAFMLLRDALRRLGAEVPGYALIQRTNAVLAVCGLYVFHRSCLRLTDDRALSALAAAGLGASFCYWSRATEGQVYMTMTLGATASAWAAVALVQEPRLGRAVDLAACAVMAVFFHAANLALAPMVLAAFGIASRRMRKAPLWGTAAAAAATVAISYAAAFRIRGWSSFAAFLSRATELAVPGRTSLGHALLGRALDLHRSVLPALQQLGSALAAPGSASAAAACGAALCGLLGWAVLVCLHRPVLRPAAAVLALWGSGFALLDMYWHGGEFFWGPPLAAGLALAAAAVAPALRGQWRRPAMGSIAACVLGLGAWNLHAGILPRARAEGNVGYQRSLFVRDHTVPMSQVVISGYGFPNAKAYLPHFAHRSQVVLELYLLHDHKDAALAGFAAFVRHRLRCGVPLYLLSDMVDDAAALAGLSRDFGVSREDIQRAFGPGQPLLVAAQDHAFRIFLFVPERHREELFAGLSYSLLADAQKTWAEETDGALRAVAGMMSPAQKRRTFEVMKSSEYGADLIYAGCSQDWTPERRRTVDAGLQRFREAQRDWVFHARLGNIMLALGLADEARREWTQAYRAGKDPILAADLARLDAGRVRGLSR